MDYMKKAIWGPDPKEQHRKIKSILRKNGREIDKSLRELSGLQIKTKTLIKQSAKKNDLKSCQIYGKELYRINKQYNRMYTSKAQLDSVQMKIEEAYKIRQLTNQMGQSADIMREVNLLVHLPQLQHTMIELEKELMKSGLISEMIDDTMENIGEQDEEMEEEVEKEVNKIISEYTNEKFNKVENVPNNKIDVEPVKMEEENEVPEDKIDEEADNMLNEMRERLKALQ
ncbi:hypothetical protein TBLA_0I01560 [Henningerozyma blattae CBS 6284]|uniref:Vacuolar protein-sorting-associated protein 24 n=1 Tax=Henningerozyma blattae (strain ATCC 34711 / CBS 6284 / DSM 70876 / NBRC 10599 / NRRL Y-10934 / UCD 77-7) TaxID=1071380 RepID=I2H8W3_HENB6|nr:hypothetical protein TBLA_0I01560 [Tetrapisispora blattae CBS 6284]CCH62815.1 hypothetical protein TBLA_0I01560 [Tetrapisispora blattae CBS 6284]